MKSITTTELKESIYKIFDEILHTKIPIEVDNDGKKLKIIPVEKPDKLANLFLKPDIIKGDPEDLVHINWEDVNLDLT